MNIRAVTIAAAILLFAFIPARAQETWHDYVNPGIKLGYTFGEGGGFTWGVELSYTLTDLEYSSHGVVLDLDFTPTFTKLHVGGQISYLFVGGEIGPTLLFDRTKGTHHFGVTATPFVGALLMPYVSGTYLVDRDPIFEAGAYGKLPMPTAGGLFLDFH